MALLAASSSSTPSSALDEEGEEEEAECPHHLAILVRSGWQLGVLEEALIRQRLPYVVQGGTCLLKTAEARAGMGVLGALLDGGREGEEEGEEGRRGRWEKVAWALGYRGAGNVWKRARREGVSVGEAARWTTMDQESQEGRGRGGGRGGDKLVTGRVPELGLLDGDVPRWRALLKREWSSPRRHKALRMVMEEAGLLPPSSSYPPRSSSSSYTSKKKGGAANDLSRLLSLIADSFDDPTHLGAWASAVHHTHLHLPSSRPQRPQGRHQQKRQQRQVVLSTMHGAKGQEFDLVFLAGWDEGVFPLLPRIPSSVGPSTLALAEERRLAYVALTRARLNAYITFTHRRRLPGGAWVTTTPSRFIGEIPRRLVRLRLLGPARMQRGIKPSNDVDFRRLRPVGVRTRQDAFLVEPRRRQGGWGGVGAGGMESEGSVPDKEGEKR
eukprot:evm.model.NODE_48038_length_28629_cov_22.408222.8